MITILLGFISLAFGLALTPQVVNFANNTMNALDNSGNTDFQSYTGFVALVVLVWIAAVVSLAGGLIYVGVKGRVA